MNCDDAFDALTDPQRRGDSELQQHLARCARCRQMEETLSPALHLFEVDQAEGEPSQYGAAVPSAAPESAAPHALQSRSRNVARRGIRRSAGRPASRTRSHLLAVAVTAVLVLGIASSWKSPNSGITPLPRLASQIEDCSWLRPETIGARARETAAAHVVAGCVTCHLAEGGSAARVQMLACVQCHAQSAGLALENPAEDMSAIGPPRPAGAAAHAACSWLRISG